jgi:hypothetical protein
VDFSGFQIPLVFLVSAGHLFTGLSTAVRCRPFASVEAAASRFEPSENWLQRIWFVSHHRRGDEKEKAIRLGRTA